MVQFDMRFRGSHSIGPFVTAPSVDALLAHRWLRGSVFRWTTFVLSWERRGNFDRLQREREVSAQTVVLNLLCALATTRSSWTLQLPASTIRILCRHLTIPFLKTASGGSCLRMTCRCTTRLARSNRCARRNEPTMFSATSFEVTC